MWMSRTAQREGLTALHDFMTANVGKFVPISGRLGVVLGDVSEHALGVAGAIGYRGEYADRKVYFMTTKAWKEVQDKARRGNIAKQLDDAGLLVRGKSDGNKRMTVRVYVPTSATTNERLYLYAVDQKFMQLGEDGTLNDDNEHIQQSDGSWADRWGNTTQPALNLATEVNAMPEQAKPVKKQRRVAPVPAVVLGEAEKRSLTRH